MKAQKPENLIKALVNKVVWRLYAIDPEKGGEWMGEIEGKIIYVRIRQVLHWGAPGNRAPEYFVWHPLFDHAWSGMINSGRIGKPGNCGGKYNIEFLKQEYAVWLKKKIHE